MQWRVSGAPVVYEEAEAGMMARAAAIAEGRAPELVWLLEHPPLYTAGVSANEADLHAPRFPVYRTGRGGQYTYHGPGQRIAYVQLDLGRRKPDVRAFVRGLETWMIRTLAAFSVTGLTRPGRPGVWVRHGGREDKIAAVGVRIRRWVTLHGVSINVNPKLSHYEAIVPCGIRDGGVTSLWALGRRATMDEVDRVLRKTFKPPEEDCRRGG